MTALLLTVALAGTPELSTEDASEAVSLVARHATSGTLIFSRGDCLAVKVFTASPYTHVAAVVEEEGTLYVYDSTNGPGVRKQTLEKYVSAARPDRMYVVNPSRRFTPRRQESFRRRLEQDLGRPYSVSHHLTGKRVEGRHCAEYVTDALLHCRLITVDSPPKVSPASLHEGVTESGVYEHVATVRIGEPPEERETGANWCHQCWIDTKSCVKGWGRGLSRTFLCR